MYKLGFLFGGLMVVVGVLMLGGWLGFSGGPSPLLRTVFGVVVLLYGIYRIVITDSERRRRERESRPLQHHDPSDL